MSDAFGTGGSPSPVSAADHRLAQAGLIAPQSSSLAVRTGVLYAPGAATLVTGTSATGTMTVSIAAHHWVTTRGTADGVYLGAKEAAGTVNIAAAPGANSRIDVVYVRQKDASSSISPDGATAEEYGVITGTAAVSPTKPSLTSVPGALELATVTVAAGATATNGAGVTISNTAALTVARGARVPCRSQAEEDALTKYAGLEIYRIDTGTIKLSNGTTFTTVYDPAGDPKGQVDGTGTQSIPTSTFTALTLATLTRANGITASSGRLTATKAGVYLVSGCVGYVGATGGTRSAQLLKNGVGISPGLATVPADPGSTPIRVPSPTLQVQMAVGDYVQIAAYQSSGGALNANLAESFLQATYIGP